LPAVELRIPALVAVLAVCGTLAFVALAAASHDNPVCAVPAPGVSCTDGNGRQTPGGHGKVSHAGWPKITGVLRMADARGRTVIGGADNDELLGAGGSDHIVGQGGNDVLWGDQLIVGNGPHQYDRLSGGPGNDWIYPSHGTNVVLGGTGNDHVIAYYGHGSIDCGPGDDTAQVRMTRAYTVRNCEHITHFCVFGSFANGDCKKPGERAILGRREPG
jgi:hemolysin type calcium-binding protein